MTYDWVHVLLLHLFLDPFLPTVAFSQPILLTFPTLAVRETDVSRHNGGTSGAPLKPLRDDSALRVLSSQGIKGGTRGQQMLERWA